MQQTMISTKAYSAPDVSVIQPVILSGGAGTRLWPVSRENLPKQLLALTGEQSLLQQTVARLAGARFAPPLVIANAEHRFMIAEQMRQQGITPTALVLEPLARNTAAAVAVAALMALERAEDPLLLVLPADHAIGDEPAFLAAVEVAALAARAGALVTFGIRPTSAHTGYGYIETGEPFEDAPGNVCHIKSFVEKPDATRAAAFVAGGRHLWNSGMFLFPAKLLLSELERFEPSVVAACRAALAAGKADLDFFRLDEDAFRASPSISIDYALMERTARACVVPSSFAWTDVGSWWSLWELGAKDENGNVALGDVSLIDTHDCYVRSESLLTATVGLKDLVIITTNDAVLVAHRDHLQGVKAVVERLRTQNRREATTHCGSYRPWGVSYRLLDTERFQVNRLTINPGARISLQRHFHRAEHWMVLAGTALVTRGEITSLLTENASADIPLGMVHRLENPGKVPLVLIEVRSGSYLGEDDIVRLDDDYGRSTPG